MDFDKVDNEETICNIEEDVESGKNKEPQQRDTGLRRSRVTKRPNSP